MSEPQKSSEDPFDVGEEVVPVGQHDCAGDSCWCKQMKRR